ncbi:hypothetical protein LP7551_04894 [Roseibium album]|nr:hypothetical protein LP7551_04894 [Roseibium album]
MQGPPPLPSFLIISITYKILPTSGLPLNLADQVFVPNLYRLSESLRRRFDEYMRHRGKASGRVDVAAAAHPRRRGWRQPSPQGAARLEAADAMSRSGGAPEPFFSIAEPGPDRDPWLETNLGGAYMKNCFEESDGHPARFLNSQPAANITKPWDVASRQITASGGKLSFAAFCTNGRNADEARPQYSKRNRSLFAKAAFFVCST